MIVLQSWTQKPGLGLTRMISPSVKVLLNNNCEVFSGYILEAREMPIISMI